MALNIKKLMTPDHPEVTHPPPPLISSNADEGVNLESHVNEEQILLETKKLEALRRRHEEKDEVQRKLNIIV